MAVQELKLKNSINVHSEYYMFEQKEYKFDIALLLNVVHHLGDDFGDSESIEKAKRGMLSCINHMAQVARTMVFQLGFNWRGDRDKCLFENGTKEEMEDFIRNGTQEYWDIVKIGVAVNRDGKIVYEDKNADNYQRQDSLGEFLNRPIYIMKSKKF